MAPTECPVCKRRMCDHTCEERGQTYAEMMGDPPGTHPHIAGGRTCGCKCDECTKPTPRWPEPGAPSFMSKCPICKLVAYPAEEHRACIRQLLASEDPDA